MLFWILFLFSGTFQSNAVVLNDKTESFFFFQDADHQNPFFFGGDYAVEYGILYNGLDQKGWQENAWDLHIKAQVNAIIQTFVQADALKFDVTLQIIDLLTEIDGLFFGQIQSHAEQIG